MAKKELLKRIQNIENIKTMEQVIDLLIQQKIALITETKLKGEPGAPGEPGAKPSPAEITEIVKAVISQNKEQFKGDSPETKEIEGLVRKVFNQNLAILRGEDGKSPDKKALKSLIVSTVKEIKDDLKGDRGESATPEDVVTLIESFEGDDRLDASAIKNLEENLDIKKVDTSDLELEARQIKNLPEPKTIIKNGGGSSGIETIRSAGATVKQGATSLNFTSGATVTPTANGVDIAISGGSGDVATDAIWDNKGDVAIGTGADTAVVIGVGTDGQVLTADSAEASGVKWSTVAGSGDVSKVGTPVDNQVGVWTGDGTLEGDADLTFNTAGNTLALAPAAGTSTFSQGGADILVDSPRGTMTLSNIDAIDATTEATLEAAIDSLVNLTTTGTVTSGTWDSAFGTTAEENIEDIVGGMLGGTQTLITVTYQDVTNDIDFVVDNDLV